MKKSQLPAFDINKVEIGTKVVTRDGHSGRINSIDLEKLDYPVSAIIELDGKEVTLIFTKEGHFYSDDKDSMFDLFLEEEEIEDQKPIQPKKQDKHEINCLHSQDKIPNGAIVYEDLNGDEGFYKVHLDYLNKEQVEEIEQTVRAWHKELKPTNDNIKACIGMCLTDANGQRFKNYNTNLRDCLAWLEKQGEQETLCDKCKKSQPSHSCQDITALGRCAVEHEQKSKPRRMTKQELARWLHEVPSEHREYKHSKIGYIDSIFVYYEQEANIPVDEYILIRRNYGKWEKPIIEE